jgi:GMP synthase-like glutamine amidotransferase
LNKVNVIEKPDWLEPILESVNLLSMHQDQVTIPPKGAVVYAASDFCQCAGFYIDDKVLTMQAHPEFLVDFNKALLIQRSSSVIPKEIVDPALVELDRGYKDVDSDNFAQSMRNFLLR